MEGNSLAQASFDSTVNTKRPVARYTPLHKGCATAFQDGDAPVVECADGIAALGSASDGRTRHAPSRGAW
jgi:hypothetical protein